MPEIPTSTAAFEFDVKRSDGHTLITLSGELDGAAAEALIPANSKLTPSDAVAIDLSQVSFVDSMGLRVLVEWDRAVKSAGGTLELHAPSHPVRRLLAATTLDQTFNIVEVEDQQNG